MDAGGAPKHQPQQRNDSNKTKQKSSVTFSNPTPDQKQPPPLASYSLAHHVVGLIKLTTLLRRQKPCEPIVSLPQVTSPRVPAWWPGGLTAQKAFLFLPVITLFVFASPAGRRFRVGNYRQNYRKIKIVRELISL